MNIFEYVLLKEIKQQIKEQEISVLFGTLLHKVSYPKNPDPSLE